LSTIAAARPLSAAAELTERAAAHDWRGPDPYDGLWWPWPRALVGGRRRRQAIVQLHARLPVDIRKLYRRRHPRLAKALGLFASAGLRAQRTSGDPRWSTLAEDAISLLMDDHSAGDFAWGYPFDVQTRWSFYTAGAPNVVVTAFAAGALLEAADDLERDDIRERALAASRWVLDELWLEREGFFAYHADSRVIVHNANLLAAALVHSALGDDVEARERVGRAVARSLAAQRPDGSFPYGGGAGLEWADSFHTGFVLSSLARLQDVDTAVAEAIQRGAQHYRTFFDEGGRATLWPDRRFPEDAHSAGTGLSTLAALVRRGYVERTLLERVTERVLVAGVRDGRAVARHYRWGRTTVWYPRWCDGHVALGLVDTAAVLGAGCDNGFTGRP
jgi:hypothetical protein